MFATKLLSVASMAALCRANNFLQAEPSTHKSRAHTSVANVRSLLEESENALGSGSTARRVARLEASLAPMFASLPKNQYGNLNDATARYALHRLFVQRHGWYVKGLEPDGEHYNASSPI